MTETSANGTHEMRREADTSFICIVQNGVLDDTGATWMIKTMEELLSATPDDKLLYVLVDVRKATGMTSGARKAFVQSSTTDHKAFVAIHGVSFVFGAALQLFSKTLSLLVANCPTLQIADNETKARAWLLEQKSAHHGRNAKTRT